MKNTCSNRELYLIAIINKLLATKPYVTKELAQILIEQWNGNAPLQFKINIEVTDD